MALTVWWKEGPLRWIRFFLTWLDIKLSNHRWNPQAQSCKRLQMCPDPPWFVPGINMVKSSGTNSILGLRCIQYLPMVNWLELGIVHLLLRLPHQRWFSSTNGFASSKEKTRADQFAKKKVQFTWPSCVHVHVEVLQWFLARSIRGSPQIETQECNTWPVLPCKVVGLETSPGWFQDSLHNAWRVPKFSAMHQCLQPSLISWLKNTER